VTGSPAIVHLDIMTMMAVRYLVFAMTHSSVGKYATTADRMCNTKKKLVEQHSHFAYVVPVSHRPYVHVLGDCSPTIPWLNHRVLSFLEDSAALDVSTLNSHTPHQPSNHARMQSIV